MAAPARSEELECTKCVEKGGGGGYECKTAGKGEDGNTGTCTGNPNGCSWGLGEKCKGGGEDN